MEEVGTKNLSKAGFIVRMDFKFPNNSLGPPS